MTANRVSMATMIEEPTLHDCEVLDRLLDYALVEAERNGEYLCAVYITQALTALRESPSGPRNNLLPLPFTAGRMIS